MYRPFGGILKKEVDVPIILTGWMENPDIAVGALGESCDIMEYGRQLLVDPDYPGRLRRGRLDEVRLCLGCHEGCLGRISKAPVSCAVNPACRREMIYGITPGVREKTVLIVGGGVADCECTRVAAARGHKMILCEKSGCLSGNLIPGGMPEFKRYDHQLVRWYERQLELAGAGVRLGQEMDAGGVERFPVDVVVTTTGSVLIRLCREELSVAVTADEVLMDRVVPGEHVVMTGGGLVGCKTRLWPAKQGRKVTVVEMLPEILGGPKVLPFMNYSMFLDLLKYHGVKILKNARVTSIYDRITSIEQEDGITQLGENTVILAVGYRSENRLYKVVKNIDRELYNVGDSSRAHSIIYAIWDTYEVARNMQRGKTGIKGQYEHLIIEGIRWVDFLPGHEGSVGGKGFHVLMNGELVPKANAWVCPTVFRITGRQSEIVASGTGAKASPHIHEGDEMYLTLGEKGAVEFYITLGDDTYYLELPSAAYIPAGLPHSIRPARFTEGTYEGPCQIYLSRDYVTEPVPEHPIRIENTEHLIVGDIQWVKSLPDHEGSVRDKGFPALMNGDLVPETNAWVCPTLSLVTGCQVRIVEAGTGPKANPHTHERDEMYPILGGEDVVEFQITLGNDTCGLTSPCAMYIPADLPRSIHATKSAQGRYGGSCQIYLDKNYVTRPT